MNNTPITAEEAHTIYQTKNPNGNIESTVENILAKIYTIIRDDAERKTYTCIPLSELGDLALFHKGNSQTKLGHTLLFKLRVLKYSTYYTLNPGGRHLYISWK